MDSLIFATTYNGQPSYIIHDRPCFPTVITNSGARFRRSNRLSKLNS